jgi:multiple sugar transport system substrate-binding protein
MKTMPKLRLWHALVGVFAVTSAARAADFDWMKYEGQTVSFLADNNAIGNAITANKAEFETLTGMTVKVDTYQEQQMRQRLVTILNARSDETDVFMTLVSREGLQFTTAGWYVDLAQFKSDVAPDYDLGGMSPALMKAATINGRLTSIPTNIEGPVIYYRKDVFAKCGVTFPTSLTELPAVAQKIKACDPTITPFVSRGLKDALAYTFSNVIHNMGGTYLKDGKSDLCSAANQAATLLYAGLLRDDGPPGVVNYTFNQIDSMYRTGRAAIAFEASNELGPMLGDGPRTTDTAITLLPPGPGGSVPTGIGWGLSISPFSTKQGPAWYFVQWATSPAVQAKFALAGVAAPRAAVGETPAVKQWIAAEPIRSEWQAAVNGIANTGSSEVGVPIVANPASRSFIGQPVDDLLLGTKPIAGACADADRGIDALITGG